MGENSSKPNSPMKYMRVKEVAKALGMDRKTVLKLVQKGKLPAMRLGKVWLIDRNILLDLIGSLTVRYENGA